MAFYHRDKGAINIMRTAWSAAIANLCQDNASGKKTWDSVRGPASACIVTLGRIGWDISLSNGWRVWIDRSGNEIDLADLPIHSLKKTLHRDIAIALCTQSIYNQEIQDDLGLWLEPTRSVVLGKDKLIGAMARSAAIGTQYTQQRVEQAG